MDTARPLPRRRLFGLSRSHPSPQPNQPHYTGLVPRAKRFFNTLDPVVSKARNRIGVGRARLSRKPGRPATHRFPGAAGPRVFAPLRPGFDTSGRPCRGRAL